MQEGPRTLQSRTCKRNCTTAKSASLLLAAIVGIVFAYSWRVAGFGYSASLASFLRLMVFIDRICWVSPVYLSKSAVFNHFEAYDEYSRSV